MDHIVFIILLTVYYTTTVMSMCYEPAYESSNYHRELSGTAPYVLVGNVIETRHNKTHQNVKLVVTCVYKGPREKKETLLRQEITFTMQHRKICEPLLRQNKLYLFFLDEKEIIRKSRKRKKKKNKGKDFTRMDKHIKKYISLGAPIPIDAMDSKVIDRLVEQVKDHGPVGQCFNVWSAWSACTTKCSVGTMLRTYPRHRKPNLTQQAVCHNAPCPTVTVGQSSSRDQRQLSKYQYQPISVHYCKSMELVRVRWCSDLCLRSTEISTAVSWEMYPTLMLCEDPITLEESLQYHNVAIPHSCGCVSLEATSQKYAVVVDNSVSSSTRKRRHRLPT